jgi:hypothetical protein
MDCRTIADGVAGLCESAFVSPTENNMTISRTDHFTSEKMTCKPMEQEENHEKLPRGSWVRNQMGNPDSKRLADTNDFHAGRLTRYD